jgi:hypothetical protein
MIIDSTKDQTILIDDDQHKRASAHSWCAQLQDNGKYYAVATIRGEKVYLHRWLMNATDDQIVDHIDGNTLNNYLCNLRFATKSQNAANRKELNANNKSGYRGVSWSKSSKKWVAQIMVNYVNYQLGRYENKEDAARAYDAAAIKHFGAFARLNFPHEHSLAIAA